MNRPVIKRVTAGAATLVAAAGIVALTGVSGTAANAADPDPILNVQYDASGTTHINKGNYNVPLGPTKLTAKVYGDESNPNSLPFKATLPLPTQEVTFKAFGYLPVRAKVVFTQVGDVTGALTVPGDGTTSATSQARYKVTLRDVIVGYTKANVGNNCSTVAPIEVNVASDPGFDLSAGSLSGTYDLGKFANCGTSTDLTNLIVPSTGNSIKLTLSNIQFL